MSYDDNVADNVPRYLDIILLADILGRQMTTELSVDNKESKHVFVSSAGWANSITGQELSVCVSVTSNTAHTGLLKNFDHKPKSSSVSPSLRK